VAVTDRAAWGADVPVSMPLPAPEQPMVPMYGFAMTQYRLVHDITAVEYEALSVPVYAPVQATGDVVADDAAIDARAPGSNA
jgi:hypothetical protein